MRVYRWDLDKTYLDTDFESMRGLFRSAVESARQKRAIPGATVLLRELARERPGWRPRIVLLSGSPTQMRSVLEQKLRMDGIRWDEFVLKDTLGSLRQGRFRAVKDQFGYKLPRLLQGRVGMGAAVREILFGDDAEADALIYSVYADVVAGRVAPIELSRLMEAAGAYPDAIVAALAAQKQIARTDAVERIFIRLDRGVERWSLDALAPRVVPVRTWFEAALVLAASGELEADALCRVHDAGTQGAAEVTDALVSLVRRSLVAPAALDALASALGAHALVPVVRRALADSPAVPVVAERARIDYLELVRAWKSRPKVASSAVQ